MKSIKSVWAKSRDFTVNLISDWMVNHPNAAFVIILLDVVIAFAIMLNMGVDTTTLN